MGPLCSSTARLPENIVISQMGVEKGQIGIPGKVCSVSFINIKVNCIQHFAQQPLRAASVLMCQIVQSVVTELRFYHRGAALGL